MQRNIESSEESLQVALSKLSSAKTKLAHEVSRREKLEEDLISMEKQTAFDKQRLIREQDEKIHALKKTWDEEKRVLLDVIQRDCNLVFEQNKGPTSIDMDGGSPRAVAVDFATNRRLQFVVGSPVDNNNNNNTPSSENNMNSSSIVISPSYSEIDKELRETEALVESLMGPKINVKC